MEKRLTYVFWLLVDDCPVEAGRLRVKGQDKLLKKQTTKAIMYVLVISSIVAAMPPVPVSL